MIIFDLDGTLYKTHETTLPPLRRLCAARGIALTHEDEYYLLHTTARHLLARVAPDMPEEEIARFMYELHEGERAAVREKGVLFDGAAELVRELYVAGQTLAICGMGEREYIRIVLERCAIAPYFSYVYARMEGKTKSEVLAKLLQDTGTCAADCLMIGDSGTDRIAAEDNGVPFIGVTYGYGADALAGCERLADSVGAMREMLLSQLKG